VRVMAEIEQKATNQVKLEGVVYQKSDKTKIDKALITAFNKALEITRTAETDEDGHYEMKDIRNGNWRISVAKSGYQTIKNQPIVIADESKTKNFSLQEGFIVKGTVNRSRNKERRSGAVVLVEDSQGVACQTAISDEDGDYTLEAMGSGEWKLRALHKHTKPSRPQKLDIKSDLKAIDFNLHDGMGTEDGKRGKSFLNQLIALFFMLIVIYLLSHHFVQVLPQSVHVALEESVQKSVNLLERTATEENNQQQTVELRQLTSYLQANANWSIVTKDMTDNEKDHLKQAAQLMSEVRLLPNKNSQVDSGTENSDIKNDAESNALVVDSKPNAPSHNSKQKALAALIILQKDLQQRALHNGYLWSKMPGRFLEILFWAAAGALVNLIWTTGLYLRQGRFYREGIVMHYSQLVVIPIMVLVVVMLLSIFSIEFKFQESSNLKLDLDNPIMLITLSFLLASRPWAIRDFIRKRADNVLGQNNPVDGK